MADKHTGFAVALNWPETYCKQPGYWYDWIGHYLGFSKHFYYRVGHAAMILIDAKNGHCHYYDFGRYHAPFRHGRVRNGLTDPALAIQIKAICKGKEISNFQEILDSMQQNFYYCGDGPLIGAYCPINFERAKAKADAVEAQGPKPFGIFRLGIRNCASFVQRVILAGQPPLKHRLNIKFKVPLLVTTSSNIGALDHLSKAAAHIEKPVFCPQPINNKLKGFLKSTLAAPQKPKSIPETAQWLSGEGLGSWYHLRQYGRYIRLTRYHQNGVFEASALFELPPNFNLSQPYQFTYPSHLTRCTLVQQGKTIQLKQVQESLEPAT